MALDPIISTIVELQPTTLLTDLTDLTDLTEMDGLAINVEHRLDPQLDGGTRITYRVEVAGAVPDEVAEEVGTAVSADFPDVIASLVAAAQTRAVANARAGAEPGFLAVARHAALAA